MLQCTSATARGKPTGWTPPANPNSNLTSFHIYVFHPVIRWSCIKSLLDTDCLLARTPQRSYVQIKYWGFRSYGPLKHLVLHWWLPRWFASFRLESGLGKWSRARRRVAKHVSPCDHFGLGLELLFVVSWPLLAEVEPTFPCDFYPWREKAFVKCLVDEQHKMGWWRRFINDILFQDFSAQTPLRGFLSSMFENHHHDNPRAQAKGSKDSKTTTLKRSNFWTFIRTVEPTKRTLPEGKPGSQPESPSAQRGEQGQHQGSGGCDHKWCQWRSRWTDLNSIKCSNDMIGYH